MNPRPLAYETSELTELLYPAMRIIFCCSCRRKRGEPPFPGSPPLSELCVEGDAFIPCYAHGVYRAYIFTVPLLVAENLVLLSFIFLLC